METSEEALIYFVPTILGERVARKVFSKGLNNELKKEVATTGVEQMCIRDRDYPALYAYSFL